jgi:hypothetical protein
MPDTKINIDQEIQQLLTNSAVNLIKKIQEDINNDTKLSERTYKTCSDILMQASRQYTRIQMAFLEETKILINKAIDNPEKRYHIVWVHLMDVYVSECERVAAPIMQVFNSVAIESERLKSKYRLFIGGTVTCSIVGTVLAGVLIVHYLPAFCFTLTAGGLSLAIGGLVVAIGLGITFVIGAINCSQIRAIYDQCVTELKTLIMKYMPDLLGKSINTVTKEQLHQAIKDGLDEFKFKEDIWLDRDILEPLQRQVDRTLKRLQENI